MKTLDFICNIHLSKHQEFIKDTSKVTLYIGQCVIFHVKEEKKLLLLSVSRFKGILARYCGWTRSMSLIWGEKTPKDLIFRTAVVSLCVHLTIRFQGNFFSTREYRSIIRWSYLQCVWFILLWMWMWLHQAVSTLQNLSTFLMLPDLWNAGWNRMNLTQAKK